MEHLRLAESEQVSAPPPASARLDLGSAWRLHNRSPATCSGTRGAFHRARPAPVPPRPVSCEAAWTAFQDLWPTAHACDNLSPSGMADLQDRFDVQARMAPDLVLPRWIDATGREPANCSLRGPASIPAGFPAT